jgi:hypothetical protein
LLDLHRLMIAWRRSFSASTAPIFARCAFSAASASAASSSAVFRHALTPCCSGGFRRGRCPDHPDLDFFAAHAADADRGVRGDRHDRYFEWFPVAGGEYARVLVLLDCVQAVADRDVAQPAGEHQADFLGARRIEEMRVDHQARVLDAGVVDETDRIARVVVEEERHRAALRPVEAHGARLVRQHLFAEPALDRLLARRGKLSLVTPSSARIWISSRSTSRESGGSFNSGIFSSP